MKLFVLLVALFATLHPFAQAQASKKDKENGLQMLRAVKEDLKKNYYDPTFRGMDVEARFATAEEKIKTAESLGQVLGIVAQVLLDLDDSHTFFMPPSRAYKVEYGWQMKLVGDQCFVSAVKPKSDAEVKGLKVGDQVLSIDGFEPVRGVLWKVKYLYYALRPAPGMRLIVQSPGAEPRQVDVLAKVKQGKRLIDMGNTIDFNQVMRDAADEDRLNPHRFVETDDLVIWQMPEFDLEPEKVDDLWGKARKRKALILDLRGNGGGYEETLKRMVANAFDRDITIGEIKGRKEKENKPLIAKSRRDDAFKGQLVVLIDSESGSAAELFARTVQLEKRGTVIGDRSAGAVMRSIHSGRKLGIDTVIFFGVSITVADLIMPDGKSIERVGVTPDEMLLPTGPDLASNRDPVLARAAAIAGITLSPEKAGTLFPFEWRK